jgi:hypothetical protein
MKVFFGTGIVFFNEGSVFYLKPNLAAALS